MRVIAVVVIGVRMAVGRSVPDIVVVIPSGIDGILAGHLIEVAGVARIVAAAAPCQCQRGKYGQSNFTGLLHSASTKLTIRRCLPGLLCCSRPGLPAPRLISRTPRNWQRSVPNWPI